MCMCEDLTLYYSHVIQFAYYSILFIIYHASVQVLSLLKPTLSMLKIMLKDYALKLKFEQCN